jgi:hypothetical protein
MPAARFNVSPNMRPSLCSSAACHRSSVQPDASLPWPIGTVRCQNVLGIGAAHGGGGDGLCTRLPRSAPQGSSVCVHWP